MPKQIDVSNYHMQYSNITNQHWHPASEEFAGGDHLLTALDNGWEMVKCVTAKHWYTGSRFVTLFQFHLQRDDNAMTMPVVETPYIRRFIHESGVPVEHAEDN